MTEPEETVEVERYALVGVAYAALMAAILLRDMAGAMPPKVYVSMPDDIRDRMNMTIYQDCFDRLPADIQEEARRFVLDEPSVQAARQVDSGDMS